MKKIALLITFFIAIISCSRIREPSITPSCLYQPFPEIEYSELKNDNLATCIFENVDLSKYENSEQFLSFLKQKYYSHPTVEEAPKTISSVIQVKKPYNISVHSKDASESPKISVIATVTDENDNIVVGLNKEDFYSVDKSLEVTNIEESRSSYDIPVDIVIVYDVSGSMRDDLEILTKNIRDFTERLETKEVDWRLGSISYSEKVKEVHNPVKHNPVKDVGRFMGWLPDKALGGHEVAEDALNAACDLEFRDNCQKMIILCSDEYIIQGFSKANICDVVKKLLNNGINVYQVLNLDQNNSEFLSAFTQGKVYNLNSGFEEILNSLERELIQRYKITCAPPLQEIEARTKRLIQEIEARTKGVIPTEIKTIIKGQVNAGDVDFKVIATLLDIKFFPLGYYKPFLEHNFSAYRSWAQVNPLYNPTIDSVLSDKRSSSAIDYTFWQIASKVDHYLYEMLEEDTVLNFTFEGFADHRSVIELRNIDGPVKVCDEEILNKYTDNKQLALLRAWYTKASLEEYLKKYCGEKYDRLLKEGRIKFIFKHFGDDGVDPESREILNNQNLSEQQKEKRYSYIRRVNISYKRK